MKIREAVSATIAIEVNAATIDLEIINAELDPLSDYSPAMAKQVARTACNVLSSILALDSVREGDMAIAYDREGIQKRLLYLAKQHGFEDIIAAFRPQVRDRSNIW